MTTTLRVRNKNLTIAGQTVYNVPILSSELIGINFLFLMYSFANALFPKGLNYR